MSKLAIADLFLNGSFCEELTEELEMNVFGGAVGAASASVGVGIYDRNGAVIEESAASATVASSSNKPFRVYAEYSFINTSASASILPR